MEKQLPKNWVETTLGEVSSKPQYGWTSKSSDSGNIRYLRTTDLSKPSVIWDNVPFCTEEPDDLSKYLLEHNDILISRAGSVGLSYRVDNPPANVVFASYLIRFKPYIDTRIVGYYLHTLAYWEHISDMSAGIAVQNVNAPKLSSLKFPLPPLAEQERIAEKLDTLFGQLDSVRGAMSRIPTLLANLRQQILTHAITGKLTQEWREKIVLINEYFNINADEHRDYEAIIPDNWCLLSFNDVVTIESNLVNPDDFLDLPLIAPDNIESMTGRLISKPLVSEIAPISPKHYFKSDTLIYSKIRPYLSKIAYVDFEGLCSADMYPLKTQLNIFYLYFYMLSSEFLAFATTAGERSVLPKINQKSLNIIPIPIPPIEEQEEIVSRVQSLFEKLDSIEQRYQMLKTKLENLPQAILHKAFKGELVEQLPTDGNATDLLREIEQLKKSLKKK